MFTYIIDSALVLLAVTMLLKGHYGTTRQIALAPLLTALLDAAFAGQLQLSLTPVLSGILIVLQLLLLVVCGHILYRDTVRARNKRARRHRRQELARSRAAFEKAAARRDTAVRRRPVCA